jgi:hypothetical protein
MRYRNDGTQPFRIVSAYADCHCTGVAKEFPEVAPGGSGTLEVTLDTFGLPLGRIDKDVSVQFSDMAEPVVVQVTVENLPNFVLTPREVDLGRLPKGIEITRTVKIQNASSRHVKLVEPTSGNARLRSGLDRSELGPGETASLTVRYAAPPSASGDFLDNLLVQTNLEAEPIFTIRIFGRVE